MPAAPAGVNVELQPRGGACDRSGIQHPSPFWAEIQVVGGGLARVEGATVEMGHRRVVSVPDEANRCALAIQMLWSHRRVCEPTR